MQKIENLKGLSQVEAEKILQTDGYNELPSQKNRVVFFILFKVLSEPMLLLLIVAGGIYFF